MTPCAVRLEGVTRAFDGVRAVSDVSLEAPAGKVTALLGASGSGKSTLLRLIAGLEPVDAGRIWLGETLVSARGVSQPAEARGVGFVFQDFALFPHLTAADNVAFGIAGEKLARMATARTWLDRVGLAHRAGAYPHELSGGEQQRVALARALAPAPRAVLLDEPFSGLDPSLRAQLRDTTLAAIAEIGATTLFVTHDADEALYVADRIAILKSGALVQAGPPREVYAHPSSPAAAAALGPVNLYAGAVAGGAMPTPFGALTTSRPDGPSLAIVRAEALRLMPGADARIVDRRPQGALDLVRVQKDGAEWRALAPGRAALGETCSVTIDPDGAFVFAPDATASPP